MTIGLVVRRPPLAVLIYRALLRLLPRDLRREHAGDAAEVFHDLYRDARRKGALDGLRLLVWSAGQLVFCAAGERWQALRGQRRGATNGARSAGGDRDASGSTRDPGGSLGRQGSPGGGGGATRVPSGSLGRRSSPGGGAGGSERVAAGGRQGSPGGGGPGGGPNDGSAGSSLEVFTNLLPDLRYAARTLAKTPAFTLSAVLILAVGIGATTTIFSAVDTVVLRSLPYPDPGELVLFTNDSHSFPDFNAWRRSLDAIETIAAAWSERVDLTGDEAPEQVPAAMVTSDFFALFGATPHLGRFFTAEDFVGEPGVAVLGHGIWQRRWGADPGIIGRTLTIDGRPVVVVGIVGPGFELPEALVEDRVDVWLPLDVENPEHRDDLGFHVLSVSGRLREGTSLPAAQEQLDAIIRARAEEFPDQYILDGSLAEVPLMPLREGTVRRVRPVLYTLLGAVGLMLLIACANVANLFLARGTERGREVALRGALGASRGRIAAQLLTESVAIAVVGGIAGIGIAYAGVGRDNVLAVIGVAEGVQHFGLDQEIERDVYVLYDRFGGGLPMLHVGIRSSAGIEVLAAGLREAVWSLEPDLPIEEIVTMPQRVSTSLAIPRFLSGLLVIFGVVAVLLASGGIYGSMLYSVGQRQHEMGIRRRPRRQRRPAHPRARRRAHGGGARIRHRRRDLPLVVVGEPGMGDRGYRRADVRGGRRAARRRGARGVLRARLEGGARQPAADAAGGVTSVPRM